MKEDPRYGEERRDIYLILREIEAGFARQMREHEERDRSEIVQRINALSAAAFPDGPDSHRLVHVAQIKAATAEEEFYRDMKVKITETGVLGLLKLILLLLSFGAGAVVSSKLGLWPAFIAWVSKS